MNDRNMELLAKAQKGDMEAFAALFEPLRPQVFAIAARTVGPVDAEDAVMNTFLKAWKALPGFGRRASLKTWLYRIAHNCSLDLIRARERRHETAFPETEDGRSALDNVADASMPAPDAAAEQGETAAGVQRALANLPDPLRIALLLRYSDGLSYSEIAAATGATMGTVMSRLFYGKQRLRKLLEATAS